MRRGCRRPSMARADGGDEAHRAARRLDSRRPDNVFEAMVGVGRDLAHGEGAADPRHWAGRQTMPKAHRDFYSYCNSVMEPGTGRRRSAPSPAIGSSPAWTATGCAHALHHHRRRAAAGRIGSRHGAGRRDHHREKGRVGPGQMIGINLAEGRLYRPGELLDEPRGPGLLQRLGQEHHRHRQPVRNAPGEPAIFPGRSWRAAITPRASPWRIWK